MRALAVLLILAGCSRAVPREGVIVIAPPQAIEQCKAQPEIAGCANVNN